MPAKTKNTKKPSSAKPNKKSISGSGGLRPAKKPNWKFMLPLVLILASIGGYMVWKSSAASDYYVVFERLPRYQMSGGSLRQVGTGQEWRRNITANPNDNSSIRTVSTPVGADETLKTSKYCVQYVVNKTVENSLKLELTAATGQNKGGLLAEVTLPKGTKSGQLKALCGNNSGLPGIAMSVKATGSGADSQNSVGIVKMYGTQYK